MKKVSKNILLGVSGGIAAYKAVNILSLLKKKSYNVDVIMTKNATEFINPLTFETLSKKAVTVDMFAKKAHIEVEHISLAEKADIVLIAPATYNIIGKVAAGIADDMLTTVISATKAPVVFALAMNNNMYENPILKENIKKLKKYGYHFIDADEGLLACATKGKGRLKKEDEIVEKLENIIQNKTSLRLQGKKVLIDLGRTEEAIDPVRYISNGSTGKMGYALAQAAQNMGAKVTVIAGKTSAEKVKNIEIVEAFTALEMYEQVKKRFLDADIAIMTAAVSDYRVKNYSQQKIKKSDDVLKLELIRNPDILYEMGQIKQKQILVGFAAESENLEENAIKKLKNKNLDMIVANNVSNMGRNTNEIVIIDKNKNRYKYKEMSKKDVAYSILEKLIEIFINEE